MRYIFYIFLKHEIYFLHIFKRRNIYFTYFWNTIYIIFLKYNKLHYTFTNRIYSDEITSMLLEHEHVH